MSVKMEEIKDDNLVSKPIIWVSIVIAIIMICWTPSNTKWSNTPLESYEYYVANNEITTEEETVIATSEVETIAAEEDDVNRVRTITVIDGVPTDQEEKVGGVVINNLSKGGILWKAFWNDHNDIFEDNILFKTEKRKKIFSNGIKYKDKVDALFVAKEINENERNYLISCIDDAVNLTMSCLDN